MIQHPIPQNVTAYEFHLIGNMTIKQFLELGSGIVIAFIVYIGDFPEFVRWPLIALSVIIGGAVAFLPFDGRPLDRMIIAFFKAVYSPTQYIWRKQAHVPDYFTYITHTTTSKPKAAERQRLRKNLGEYLQTLPDEQTSSDFDNQELQFLSHFSDLFDSTPAAQGVTAATTEIVPQASPKVRIRAIKPESQLPQVARNLDYSTLAASIKVPANTPQDVQVKQEAIKPQQQAKQTLNQALPTPSQTGIKRSTDPKSLKTAIQNRDLPFPNLPDTPNTLVGMVLDPNGKIVENAIVEVRDQNRLPIRALKSNKLGQFFSATPLSNGDYEIEAEKDGLSFDNLKLKLSGKVVPPLEIKAKTTN